MVHGSTPLADGWNISERARDLHERALVCDLHGCMPLRPDADLSELSRYRRSGANYISINVGMDLNSWPDTVKVLAHFRAWVLARGDEYVLAGTAADVRDAFREGKLAVVFDLEGAEAIAGQISMIPARAAILLAKTRKSPMEVSVCRKLSPIGEICIG